ncbi:penicillin-binding protein activator LpoB [Marinobacter sp. SS21]|uniref:penicillin-binding protein activator LpoB n=1 Tax=Marinobacter sp. SS21 TaxID=2979460 RepID=UPI0023305728|nr:penicillin-binding protein activator LpoB [Marinobacter sp. SS21]MDC0661557.1 penicillin-binding protein activator LpoB [Marinobacter sp. SS21]
MIKPLAVATLSTLLLAACAAPTRYIDPAADDGPVTMTMDYRDFERAADAAIQDLLASGAVDRPGGERYVMAVSRIVNDTMQRIDTDQLVKKIRVALLRSGKVITTTAVGLDGAEDEMNLAARELRESAEFDQSTVQQKGTLQAPDLSLSGKIIQRNHKVDDEQQVEYYFQLSLTDLRRGLAIWENETPIIKRGSDDAVAW